MNNEMKYVCTAIANRPARLAADRREIWEPGQEILIGWFSQTSKSIQDRVIQSADKWLEYANVKFIWIGSSNRAMVRIGFTEGGSWSYIGRECLQVPRSQPTMNFGWLEQDTPEEEYDRTVIHEFGHMLGMIHEHQNPAGGIKWSKETVYNAYEKTMGWTKFMVDANVFAVYNRDHTQYSEFDPDSIMCYHIPPHFTTNGFTNGSNCKLSPTDIAFVREVYPKENIGEN